MNGGQATPTSRGPRAESMQSIDSSIVEQEAEDGAVTDVVDESDVASGAGGSKKKKHRKKKTAATGAVAASATSADLPTISPWFEVGYCFILG